MVDDPMQPDPNEPRRQPLEYGRRAAPSSGRGAWIGLIITLAFCLAAAIIYLARK